jgi:hypothetical protein
MFSLLISITEISRKAVSRNPCGIKNVKHDDTSFVVNEEFSNIWYQFLSYHNVCDGPLLRCLSRLSWTVAQMSVTVCDEVKRTCVCHVGVP